MSPSATGENSTKRHACHAKRQDNLLGNLWKGEVLQLPPIDTATVEENHRIETRHVGASKRAFRARPPPIFILCSFKTDGVPGVSHEPPNLLPQNRCFVRGFRQFSSHLTKCYACHWICTLSPLHAALTMRFAKVRNTTCLKCCCCHAKWRMQLIFWERRRGIAPATQSDFGHVMKNVGMTQSATLAARNEATQRLKLPKVTTLAKLAIGTAIRPSRDRPWTVAKGADGRDRKRNVERAHPQPPDPRVNREPLLRIREKTAR